MSKPLAVSLHKDCSISSNSIMRALKVRTLLHMRGNVAGALCKQALAVRRFT